MNPEHHHGWPGLKMGAGLSQTKETAAAVAGIWLCVLVAN